MSPTLFDMMDFYDRRCDKPAVTRNAIGEVVEEMACRALGVQRQKVDGRKAVCVDAIAPETGHPFEIKAVGKNNRALIYKWRLEKELREIGPSLGYAFIRHDCRVTLSSGAAVADYLRDHPPQVLLTTAYSVQAVTSRMPVRQFSLFTKPQAGKRCGYTRAGYIEGGWQFSLAEFEVLGGETRQVQWRGQNIPVRVNIAVAKSV